MQDWTPEMDLPSCHKKFNPGKGEILPWVGWYQLPVRITLIVVTQYSECCFGDVLVNVERHLPSSKQNNSISGVQIKRSLGTSANQIPIFQKKNLKGGPSNRPANDVVFLRTLSIQLVSFYPSQPKRGEEKSKRKRFRGDEKDSQYMPPLILGNAMGNALQYWYNRRFEVQ